MRRLRTSEAFIVNPKQKSKSQWGTLSRFLMEPDDDEDEDEDDDEGEGERQDRNDLGTGKEPKSDDPVELEPIEPTPIIVDPTTKDSENELGADKDQKKGTTA